MTSPITNPRVLITAAFLRPGDPLLRPLEDAGIELTFATSRDLTDAEWIATLAQVDGAIVGSDRFPAAVLASCDRLKVIARGGVGYDAIDVVAATEQGIAVCVKAGLNHGSVAEMALTLILASMRRLAENTRDYANGGWRRFDGSELGGATVGIVGMGRIGKRLVELLAPFHVKVLAHDTYQDDVFAGTHNVTYVGPEQLLGDADVVSLHPALTPATFHWLSHDRLRLMKPTAYIVNTARGEVIDQDALVQALQSGVIAGAALDVAVGEPLAEDHPLRALPNVLLSPHIGGATSQARNLGGAAAVSNVIAVLRGEMPDDVINPPFAAHTRGGSILLRKEMS